MRIISQDRRIDVPYETSVIKRSDNLIFADSNGIGNYDSYERAKDVMESIQHALICGSKVFRMPEK